MINQVILVGRLTKDPEIVETSIGKSVCEVTLAMTRPFKNATSHTYDTDYIKVTMWDYLAINLGEYCKKGATVGVRGRLQMKPLRVENTTVQIPEIVGEQLIFISKAPVAKKDAADEKETEESIDDIL